MSTSNQKKTKVSAPENARFCHIESASIIDSNDAGDGAYDLIGVEGSPEEVGAEILKALKECDLSAGIHGSLLDKGETLTLSIHVKIRKIGLDLGADVPSIDRDTPWYIRFDDGHLCDEGGWKTREEAQAFLDAEVGMPAHVELFS